MSKMYRNIVLVLVALHLIIVTSGLVANRRDTESGKAELMHELECLLNRHREQSQVHAQMVNMDKLKLMRDELRKLLIVMEGVYEDVATCVEEGKSTITEIPTDQTPTSYANCQEALRAGETESKVYMIQSPVQNNQVTEILYSAFCDMETDGGGWTVFQRRTNGVLDFNRTWQEYSQGFGSPDGEYWLGLDPLYQLISSQPSKQMELYIKLDEFNGDSTYAKYRTFSIGDRDSKYKLKSSSYSGTAGGDGLSYSHNSGFSTYDQDNDERSSGGPQCAAERTGAWWYNNCMMSNLNGKYRESANANHKYGFSWHNLKKKYNYFLKGSVMMVRPKP